MIKAYSVDEIVIIRDGGYDTRGEPLATTDEAAQGYVERKTRLVRNFAGEEVVSRGYVFITYDGTLDHKDKIKINGTEYVIVAFEPAKDFSNVGLRIYIV